MNHKKTNKKGKKLKICENFGHNYQELVSHFDNNGPVFAKPITLFCSRCGKLIEPFK